jgi:cytochrome c biogenesis protein CcdA/thiol-disulfide isomerase/thioredoxin
MVLLSAFALLAGAGTALSPCVLPVLPAILSAGATGGRRRPLGIVAGLTATFTVTIVGAAAVTDSVGLGSAATRDAAIVALALFGLATLVPAVGDRIEARLSPLARYGPRRLGNGFGSGLAVGAALGFVYAPCAGPILAAVIVVGAASGRAIVVGVAFALGSAASLLALALGGRALLDRLRRRGRVLALRRALGAIMLCTAVAMALQLDVRFQSAIARHLPATLVDPTRSLENSSAVRDKLAGLHPRSRFASAPMPHGARASGLPDLGRAPDFTGTQRWFNTPGGRPLALSQLRGRVVLVDFWTYTCINCLRTLPYLEAWDARYRRAGLTIVGVHSPEFGFEKDAGNVARATRREGIRYPVVQDNRLATWDAWGNQSWPAEYLIDARGHVRSAEEGEGGYAEKESAIRALLAERGRTGLGARARPRGVVVPSRVATPETYLGLERARGFLADPVRGTHRYSGGTPGLNEFAYSGTWRISGESATAVSAARLDALVQARHVYLVLSSPGGPRQVRVSLDGRQTRVVTVRRQRLYSLVDLPRNERHRLSLRLDSGVSGFAFTFG